MKFYIGLALYIVFVAVLISGCLKVSGDMKGKDE